MVPPKFSAGRAPFVAPLARGTGRGRLRPCSAAVFASSLPVGRFQPQASFSVRRCGGYLCGLHAVSTIISIQGKMSRVGETEGRFAALRVCLSCRFAAIHLLLPQRKRPFPLEKAAPADAFRSATAAQRRHLARRCRNGISELSLFRGSERYAACGDAFGRWGVSGGGIRNPPPDCVFGNFLRSQKVTPRRALYEVENS